MADKSFPKSHAKQQYIPRYEIQNQVHLPERNENENINNQLFLLFTNGNYLEIKDFINKYHSLVDIRDENNNNILHKIIENETMTENEKIELVNLAISKTINVSESNIYNITPLHLACQFQSKKMVDLLLKNGAEINKQDNNGYSPIHYAIMGLSIDCDYVDNYKKTKKITKKSDKDEKIDDNLKDLMNDINQYFVGDDNDDVIRTNLNHLGIYLKNFKAIFPDRHKKFSEDAKTIISEVISNPNLSRDDKDRTLLKKIITERDSLMREYNDIVETDVVIDLKIQAMKNGWNPDKDYNKNNFVMKKQNINDIIKKLEEKVDELKLENDKSKEIILKNINQNYDKYDTYYNNISQIIGNLFYYLENFNRVIFREGKLGGDVLQKTINLIYYFPNIDKLILPEINMSNEIGILNNTTITFNISNINIDITSKIKKKENLHYTYYNVLEIINYIRKTYRESTFGTQMGIFRNFVEFDLGDIEDENGDVIDNIDICYEKLNKKIKDENLENEVYPNSDHKLIRYLHFFGVENSHNVFDDNRIYIFSELRFYLLRFQTIKKKLLEIMTNIETNLKNNRLDTIFNNNFTELITNLINAGIILKIIKKLYNNYEKLQEQLNNNISNIFDNINNTINKIPNANNQHTTFINAVKLNTKIIKKDIKDMIDEFKSANEQFLSTNEFYKKSLYPIFDWMKNIIKYIENKSSLEILKKYHSDININNKNTGQINNIIGYKFLNDNNDVLDILDKFMEDYKENFNYYPEMKKKMLEKYIPKISEKYPEIFYEQPQENPNNEIILQYNIPPPPNQVPVVGGVLNSGKKIMNGGAIIENLRSGYLVEQNNRQQYINGINGVQPLGIRETYILDQNKILNIGNIVGEFGNIMIEESGQFPKSKLMYPIVFSSEFARYHVGMIKYYILTTRLNNIYDLINTQDVQSLQPLERKIYNKIKEFEKSINKFKSGENDHSAILVILGNYMKNLIEKLISDFIFVGSNETILHEIRIMGMTIFYKELEESLKNKGTIQDVILMKKINGYQLSLDKIYKNIFNNGDIQKIDMFSQLGKITQGNINEPIKNKYEGKVHKILNSNYSQLKSWKESCYFIDLDIVENLSKNKYLDINIGDKNNQSPIFKAIELKNLDAIKILRKNHASVKQRDINGDTAVKFALKSYKKTIDKKYVNIYDICDQLNIDVFDDFKNKYDNNLPINTHIIFKMALHLLNHHFLLLAGIYRGGWTFNNLNKLQDDLKNEGFQFNSALPILDISLTIDDFSQFDVYNLKIKQTSENLDKISNTIKEINEELSNLRGEEIYINRKQHPLSPYDVSRLQIIINEINRKNGDLQNLNNEFSQINNDKIQIINIAQQEFNNYKKNFDRNNKFPIFNSVIKLYDYVFIDIINYNNSDNLRENIYKYDTNYMTYANIWRKYLDNSKNNIDYTSFMEMLNIFQDKILNEKDTNVKEKLIKCDSAFIFYNKVVDPYIKDYNELPKELNSVNKCLDTIIDIIIHIVKRIILVSFYYEILANIQAYLEESFIISDGKIDNAMIITFLDSILKGESKLPDYIFRVLPQKLVKKTLNIYKNEDDYDDLDKDDATSIDDLYNNILNIIISNTTIVIDNNSPLILNIKEKTILRHKEYNGIAIEKMFLLMNNYLFYLYDQCKDINILLTIV